MHEHSNRDSAKVGFWEIALWIVVGLVLARLAYSEWPLPGVLAGLTLALIGGLSMLGRISRPRLGMARALTTAGIGVLLIGASAPELLLQRELATLEKRDVEEYLSRVKTTRPDSVWLAELERISPRRFNDEMLRREDEGMRRAATRARNREHNERVEQAQRAAASEQVPSATNPIDASVFAERLTRDYVQALRNNVEELEAFQAERYVDEDDLRWMLDYFEGFGEFVDRGWRMPLDDDAEELRERMRTLLSELQVRELPKMRDAYGPIQRGESARNLFVREVELRTIGQDFDTIEYVGARYLIKALAVEDYDAVKDDLRRLRFREAQFRQEARGAGTQFYVLPAAKDAQVGFWRENSYFAEAR